MKLFAELWAGFTYGKSMGVAPGTQETERNPTDAHTLSQNSQAQLLTSIPERPAFGAREQAMLRFTVNTGLRVAELVGLVVGNVCGAKPDGAGRMCATSWHSPPRWPRVAARALSRSTPRPARRCSRS